MFFQNPFDQEFQGYLVLSDRRLSPTFKVDANKNLQSNQVSWNKAPYDLSSSGLLEFNFSFDINFKNWSKVSINVSGSNPGETKAIEVVNILNLNEAFSSILYASVSPDGNSVSVTKRTVKNVKFYFGNSGAEKVLGFNKKAGVAELPSYFKRHTIENINVFEDSLGMLIKLDETDPTDQSIIENAGLNPANMKEDWQLLRGRGAGLFTFQKITVDASDRITQIIEYPAGALAGDFAKKTNYTYDSLNKNPSSITEIPYTLTDFDLLNP